MYILNDFEDAVQLLSEAIENGYDYGRCIHEVSMRFNLDNNKTKAVINIMNNHNYEKDSDYEEFKIHLENIMILNNYKSYL